MGKISAFTALTTPATDDLLVTVDVHDTTMASTGTDKKITVGNLLYPAAAVQALSNSSTITAGYSGILPVTETGNVTGIILAAPTGAVSTEVTVLNRSAFTITFAAAGTSHVAGGTANVIPALGACTFTYDPGTSLWYATEATVSGVALDATAADFQPDGVAAAGSTGKAADAGHVHPFQAWQFNVQAAAYGAKGDGKVITDATIGAGALTTLTSASAGFTSADTGKHIVVTQAGGSAHTALFATITFVNSTTVTLSTAAAAGGVTSVGAIYGTDDTAAIQAAVNAAVTYAQGSASQFAEVVFPPAYYVVAGAPVTAGATLGNSQITLPVVTATSGYKVTLKLTGIADCTAPPEHWLQVTQTAPGSVLVCASGAGTYDATYGPSAMIGGPVSGYGGSSAVFSNMQVIVEGLTCLLPYTTTIGGLCLFGVGQAWVKSLSVMPMAVASGAGASAWPHLAANSGPPDNQYPSGLIMPAVGNNALADVDSYTCYGQNFALAGADHLKVLSMRTIFCGQGWCVSGGGSPFPSTAHGVFIGSWCCEETAQAITAFEGTIAWSGYKLQSTTAIHVMALDLETFTNFIVTGDSNGYLLGEIWFENERTAAQPWYNSPLADHYSVSLKSLESTHGPVSSPQAAPSSTVAWQNLYYRDAEITLSVAAGTLSALTITGLSAVSQTVPASTTFYRFTLPAGASYTPTYTGTLTHTVTLL